MSEAILKITDGTTEINLLSLPGYQLESWRPSIADYKGGGTWRQSALSDGRRLVDAQFNNTIDTFRFKMRQDSADAAYYDLQEILRMLEKAADYWAASWPTQYVYIIAQSAQETNPRYAIVQVGRIPEYENPYAQPFLQPDCVAVMDNMTVIIEHGHWLDSTVDNPDCLEVGATQAWCASYPLVFDGADSYVDLASPADLDDLPGADFTIDGWIKPSGYGEGNAGRIFDKSSWFFTVNSTVGLRAFADFDVLDAEGQSVVSALTLGSWQHVAAVWNQANGLFTLYIDGEDVTNFQQAGNAIYQTDAALTAYIGSNGGPGTRTFAGSIGWLRISDIERWTAKFTPPARCILPDDADTVWLGIYEGTPDPPGAGDIHDISGNGNDGDASDCVWDDCCNVNYGNYLPCSPRYMVFNGTSSVVNLGSAAVLDDLPSTSDFTVDGWIKAEGYGENNAGQVLNKANWFIQASPTFGLVAFALFDVTSALSRTTLDAFSADGEWHHFAVVWDFSRKQFMIYIDGGNATGSIITGANNYTADAASILYLGNRAANDRTWDGDVGWIRISTYKRYTAGFTPPLRCTVPTVETNDVAIWSYTDEDTIRDFSWNGNDGTPTDVANDCDCLTDAREETCDEGTVYAANKGNTAQLTHIFIDDGGVISANLLDSALPYPLLPAVPAADDRIYFGIDTAIADSGPFCSLVFDLQSVQADIADIVWEYWNGAWVALTVQDNTDQDGEMSGASFDTLGVKSVHWEQPSDWTTVVVNGITGYWVRAEVQDAGTAPPVQQNRQLYTVTWPYLEVQADKVGGDIPSLIRQYIRNQSDDDLSSTPELFSNRALVGLRTVDRGDNFSAYINLADEQNPTGITVTAGGGSYTFQTDVQTPTGRKLQCLNTPAAATVLGVIRWNATISPEYYGKFHVFIRGYQYNGAAGDIELQLQGSVGSAAVKDLTDFIPFQTTSDWELIDMGGITFPFSSSLAPSESGIVEIAILATGNATTDFDLYDVFMLPVDEWAIDSMDVNLSDPVASGLGNRRDLDLNTYLDIDGITWPKNKSKVLLKEVSTERLDNDWVPIPNGDPIAQANATQRYWFLHTDTSDNPEIGSRFEVVNSLQMWRLQRYLGSRGAR